MRAARWLAVAAAALLLVLWTAGAWPVLTPVHPEVPPESLLAELPWHGRYTDEWVDETIQWRRTWSDGTTMHAEVRTLPGDAANGLDRFQPDDAPPPATLATSQVVGRLTDPKDPESPRYLWAAQYGQFEVALWSGQDAISRDRDIVVVDQHVAVQFHYASWSARFGQWVRMLVPYYLVVLPWAAVGVVAIALAVRDFRRARTTRPAT